MRLGDHFPLAAPRGRYVTAQISECACARVPEGTPDPEDTLYELLSRWLLDHDLVGHEPSLRTPELYIGDFSWYTSILAYKWPL